MALQRAASLPFSIGGRLELTHVGHDSENEAEMHARLDEERERLREALGSITVLTSVLHGDTAASLLERARHTRAELIVLGKHGARTWRDTLLGTTADRVVHDGSVSTLVVADRANGPYRQPLVAVDFSASSRLALELSARVSRPENGAITALYVASPGMADGDELLLADPTVRRDMVLDAARRQIDLFLDGLALHVRPRAAVQIGEPGAWILEVARQRDSDLVLVGSAGKGIVKRALLGSVAQRVMREATCDVLIARLPEVRV